MWIYNIFFDNYVQFSNLFWFSSICWKLFKTLNQFYLYSTFFYQQKLTQTLFCRWEHYVQNSFTVWCQSENKLGRDWLLCGWGKSCIHNFSWYFRWTCTNWGFESATEQRCSILTFTVQTVSQDRFQGKNCLQPLITYFFITLHQSSWSPGVKFPLKIFENINLKLFFLQISWKWFLFVYHSAVLNGYINSNTQFFVRHMIL